MGFSFTAKGHVSRLLQLQLLLAPHPQPCMCWGILHPQGQEIRAGVTARPSNLALALGVGDPTQSEAREREKP